MISTNDLVATMSAYDVQITKLWNLILKLDFNVNLTKKNKKILHSNLNNIQLHYAISLLDMSIGLKYLMGAYLLKDLVGCRYFIRTLAVSCCSVFESKKGLKQTNLEQYINTPKTKNVANKVKKLLEKVEDLDKKYDPDLRIIRNKIGAHKDGSGSKQLKQLKSIDPSNIESTIETFKEIFDGIVPLCIGIKDLEKQLRN